VSAVAALKKFFLLSKSIPDFERRSQVARNPLKINLPNLPAGGFHLSCGDANKRREAFRLPFFQENKILDFFGISPGPSAR